MSREVRKRNYLSPFLSGDVIMSNWENNFGAVSNWEMSFKE